MRIAFVCSAAGLALLASAPAFADAGFKQIRAELTGYQEVPAVSTPASGELRARIFDDGSAISYELSYSGLQGGAAQAHIHFGDKDTNGGVSVWLCSNLASPPTPPGVQPCPSPAGTISGSFTAADVVGPAGQGIAPGEFDELLAALRAGLTYVNVHTTTFPGGEIRSQLRPRHGAGHRP